MVALKAKKERGVKYRIDAAVKVGRSRRRLLVLEKITTSVALGEFK